MGLEIHLKFRAEELKEKTAKQRDGDNSNDIDGKFTC